MVDLGNRPEWFLQTSEGTVFEGSGRHWSLQEEFHISSLVVMEIIVVGDENFRRSGFCYGVPTISGCCFGVPTILGVDTDPLPNTKEDIRQVA